MAHKAETQHALLIPWGRFAHKIGLVSAIEAVNLHQKTYVHTPQRKALEFFVAILAGTRQLQEISRASHPLDKDVAVAQAWGQTAWADYSGVSRALQSLTWDEAYALAAALNKVSQPFLAQELSLITNPQYDGDLTGLPVSNTSRTYPNAAFGHMSDEVRLGYQAGVVSLQSPTYGRLWVSVEAHAGETDSSSQALNMVVAAEKRTEQRPRRRTELLEMRIEAFIHSRKPAEERLETQKANLEKVIREYQETLDLLKTLKKAPEPKPKRIETLERRLIRRQKAVDTAQKKLGKTTQHLTAHLETEKKLRQRLAEFQQDNAENTHPISSVFRLDAGFGTYENIALLIEMGYEIYVKMHNHKIAQMLKAKADQSMTWERVGKNAEMIAWKDFQPEHFPYKLDLALERFHTGEKVKHSTLAHFGDTPVTTDLPVWFGQYNARQTIEAGIKETKQVFQLHRLKVRSEPAIFLQETMTTFAANFIRWATVWISQNAQQDENTLPVERMSIKKQVQVAANTSAIVIQNSDGMLLMFSNASVFAGKQLFFRNQQRPTPRSVFLRFLRFRY